MYGFQIKRLSLVGLGCSLGGTKQSAQAKYLTIIQSRTQASARLYNKPTQTTVLITLTLMCQSILQQWTQLHTIQYYTNRSLL